MTPDHSAVNGAAPRSRRVVRRAPPPLAPRDAIDERVEREQRHAKPDLQAAPHRPLYGGRVDQRDQVVLDERVPIDAAAGRVPKRVLERRQRADLAAQHDPGTPGERRQVQPGEPRPAQHRKPARDDEADEAQMQDEHGVGEQAVVHGRLRSTLRAHLTRQGRCRDKTRRKPLQRNRARAARGGPRRISGAMIRAPRRINQPRISRA